MPKPPKTLVADVGQRPRRPDDQPGVQVWSPPRKDGPTVVYLRNHNEEDETPTDKGFSQCYEWRVPKRRAARWAIAFGHTIRRVGMRKCDLAEHPPPKEIVDAETS